MNEKLISSNKPNNDYKSSIKDDESVRSFLLKNNNFFKENSDLLNKLNFPHMNIGSNQSLLERQNLNLKKKIEDYERKFSLLIDAADSNERVYVNLINWVKNLLDSKKVDINPIFFFKLLEDNFEVKFSSILLLKNDFCDYGDFSEFLLASNHPLETLLNSLSKIDFFQIPSPEAKKWLDFYNIEDERLILNARQVELSNSNELSIKSGSMAILPLKDSDKKQNLIGALIMVSDENHKFKDGKGVVFLDSIAQILTSILISKF